MSATNPGLSPRSVCVPKVNIVTVMFTFLLHPRLMNKDSIQCAAHVSFALISLIPFKLISSRRITTVYQIRGDMELSVFTIF